MPGRWFWCVVAVVVHGLIPLRARFYLFWFSVPCIYDILPPFIHARGDHHSTAGSPAGTDCSHIPPRSGSPCSTGNNGRRAGVKPSHRAASTRRNGRWKKPARSPGTARTRSRRGRPGRRPAPPIHPLDSRRGTAPIRGVRQNLGGGALHSGRNPIPPGRGPPPPGPEPGQLAGPGDPLQRAGEHPGKGQSAQPLAKPAGVPFAAFGQRQVGQSVCWPVRLQAVSP